MIDLSEELTTGPLSSEILPYIETKNFDAILAAFNRKDIAIRGKLTVHDVKQYISLLGLRIGERPRCAPETADVPDAQ